MGSIVVTHDENGTGQVTDPHYEFALVLGDRTVLADTRTELIDQLFPELQYSGLLAGPHGAEEAAWARYTTAANLADQASAAILAGMANDGLIDVATDLSEDELNTLMPANRIGVAPFEGEWQRTDIPLILIRSDYQPHSPRELPTGNVRFLDPTNETTFIDSLVELGIAELHVREATD